MGTIMSVGSQYRGPEIADQFNGADRAFRKLVVDKHVEGFSEVVGELAFLLRVSGSLGRFEGQPVEEFKLNRKGRWISVDWLFQQEDWQGRSRGDLLRVFARRMTATIPYVAEQCRKRKIEIDESVFAQSMRAYIGEIEAAASIADAGGG